MATPYQIEIADRVRNSKNPQEMGEIIAELILEVEKLRKTQCACSRKDK